MAFIKIECSFFICTCFPATFPILLVITMVRNVIDIIKIEEVHHSLLRDKLKGRLRDLGDVDSNRAEVQHFWCLHLPENKPFDKPADKFCFTFSKYYFEFCSPFLNVSAKKLLTLL